jgi:hypothetical protein
MWLWGCTFCVLSSPFLQLSCSPHPQSPLRTALPFTPLGSTHLIICCSVSNKRKNFCIHFKLVIMCNSFVISVFDSIVILWLSRKEHQQMEMFPIYYFFLILSGVRSEDNMPSTQCHNPEDKDIFTYMRASNLILLDYLNKYLGCHLQDIHGKHFFIHQLV